MARRITRVRDSVNLDRGDPCTNMWCAVLDRAFGDLTGVGIPDKWGKQNRRNTQMAALSWFGTRQFEIVCSLAGVDPERTYDRAMQVARDSFGISPARS